MEPYMDIHGHIWTSLPAVFAKMSSPIVAGQYWCAAISLYINQKSWGPLNPLGLLDFRFWASGAQPVFLVVCRPPKVWFKPVYEFSLCLARSFQLEEEEEEECLRCDILFD